MTSTKIVGSGKFTYEVHENWARLPAGWQMPAASVAGDSQERIYCFNRDLAHPVIVFDQDGNYLSSWGKGMFTFPHEIKFDKEDNLWLVDRDQGLIYKCTKEGKILMTIGTRGYRSDTGVDQTDFGSDAFKRVKRASGPFNLPAGINFNDSGEIFIADGYANARVHMFSADGKLLLSWGTPGTGPGQCNLPHGVWIDRLGRVLVTDRENDRIQIFDQNGTFLTAWKTKLIGAAVIFVDDDDIVYVAEHNGGLISVLDLEGRRLAQWGGIIHKGCHGIWVDSRKDIYVVQAGDWGRDRRVVKFVRTGQ